MPANTRILAIFSALVCASACADVPVSQSADSAAEPATGEVTENAGEYSSEENISQYVPEVGLTTAAVVGGKESAPCGWPSTVDISGCTGTLIHPRVVTTAAHCLSGSSARITFTAGKGQSGSFTVMGQCKSGARGASGGSTGRDWGYCVIPEDERVKKMQITPPLVGCEADRYLKPGNNAWVVGFGTTGSGRNDNGIKREVEVKINKVQNGIVDIGDKDVGACHGDSGGPLYMKITDGTHDWGWRVAGSTSGAGGPCDCACSTVYVDIRQHVKAIEEQEDIDVTPCTDADGKWEPGPDCKDFITDPGTATGTYPACVAPTTKEPIASCGEPGVSGGAAGAAAGAAGGGAAGRSAAGSGAVAAAGSGGAPASGAAGSPGGIGVAGASAGTAGASAAAGTGALATAGRPGVGVGVAGGGATAGRPALPGAGTTGSITNAATAAGTVGVATGAQATAPQEDSGGCQAVSGSDPSRAFGLFGTLLIGLSVRSVRSRQRRKLDAI